MGYSRRRYGLDGRPRYTAYYHDLRGRERSAGTFPRKKDADRAWQAAEARVAEGRGMDMRRGRQRFGDYVTKTWLPNHAIELSTRQSYTYVINKYILPEFEAMPMIEIMPRHRPTCASPGRFRGILQRALRTAVAPDRRGNWQAGKPLRGRLRQPLRRPGVRPGCDQ